MSFGNPWRQEAWQVGLNNLYSGELTDQCWWHRDWGCWLYTSSHPEWQRCHSGSCWSAILLLPRREKHQQMAVNSNSQQNKASALAHTLAEIMFPFCNKKHPDSQASMYIFNIISTPVTVNKEHNWTREERMKEIKMNKYRIKYILQCVQNPMVCYIHVIKRKVHLTWGKVAVYLDI